MSTMNPSIFPCDSSSGGERKVFNHLRDNAQNWYVIHSFNLPLNPSVAIGESDFIVIAPDMGIIVLEIKSGAVERLEDGRWKFTNRNGKIDKKAADWGPFQQAQAGMYALSDLLSKRLGEHFAWYNMRYSFGVIFTYEDRFDMSLYPEQESWRLCKSPNGNYTKYIKDLIANEIQKAKDHNNDEWQQKYLDFCKIYRDPNYISDHDSVRRMAYLKGPDQDEAKRIYHTLRPTITYTEPLKSFTELTEQDIIKYTDEQFACLTDIEENDQVVVIGGAGTGKTLIAIKEAEYYAALGKKVGMFCYNKPVAEYIRKNIGENPNIIAKNFHSFISNGPIPSGQRSDQDYFENILPQQYLAGIGSAEPMFDVIIIDEFQDLCIDSYLKVLDRILKGGLFDGKYTFFGDFDNQAIYNGRVKLSTLKNYSKYTKKLLTKNCRNTQNIGTEICNVSGCKCNNYINDIAGERVDYFCCDSPEKAKKQLLTEIGKRKGGTEPIIVLSPFSRENSIISQIDPYKLIIGDYSMENRAKTPALFSTIHSFKGLEAQTVFLIDINNYDNEKMMYVALSRARTKLIVFESAEAKKQRMNKLVQAIL